MKITLRDMFWLILVIAILCAAWVRDRSQQAAFKTALRLERTEHQKTAAFLTNQLTRLTAKIYELENTMP